MWPSLTFTAGLYLFHSIVNKKKYIALNIYVALASDNNSKYAAEFFFLKA